MTLFRSARFWGAVFAFVCIACTGAAVSVAREDSAEIESRVDKVFAAYDKPNSAGCSLGVVRDGNLIYKRGYGEGSIELGVSLTPESVFYMDSVSKQFTAASVVAGGGARLSLSRRRHSQIHSRGSVLRQDDYDS